MQLPACEDSDDICALRWWQCVLIQRQNNLHMAQMSADGQLSRYLSNKAVQALLPQHVLLFHAAHCLSCLVKEAQISTSHATCLQQPQTQHIGSICISC